MCASRRRTLRTGELETEAERTRAEVAATLRELAGQLEGDGPVALTLGGTEVRVNPTEPVTFKLEGETDWSAGETTIKQSIEIELVRRREVETAGEARLDVRE